MKKAFYQGVGLIEILLTIAIAAAVMAYAVHYFYQVNQTNRLNDLVKQIGTLYRGGTAYTNTLKYRNLGTGTIEIQSELISGNYISLHDLFNFWNKSENKTLQVKLTTNNNSQNGIIIYIPTLPANICNGLSTRLQAIYDNMTISSCSSATSGVTLTFTNLI